MKTFVPVQFEKFRAQLHAARQKHTRAIAAFDADGTLWNTDLGEALFDYQVRNKLVPLPPDPWKHYEDLKVQKSHEVAYLWLAQINKGVPLKQVQTWAQKAVDEMAPVPIFPQMKILIQDLLQMKVEVFIVTASIQWAVEPGAPLLGLRPKDVIGIRTRVDQGVVTDQQEGVITYRQGKPEALLQATGGIRPFFCAGNTEGDLPLLEAATDLRLVLAASPPDNRNYTTERRMLEITRERDWAAHDFLE